jgi:hypothetical protein
MGAEEVETDSTVGADRIAGVRRCRELLRVQEAAQELGAAVVVDPGREATVCDPILLLLTLSSSSC